MRWLPVLALIYCGATKPPDATIDGIQVYWGGFEPRNAELRTALKVIRDHAEAECHQSHWQGELYFQAEPFDCNGRKHVGGCMPFEWVFAVGYRTPLWRSTLIDEIGHAVWQQCHGRGGEDSKGDPDRDYAEWVSATRDDVKEATE